MRRREFINLVCGVAAAWPISAACFDVGIIVAAIIIQPQPVQASCYALINGTCDKEVTVKPGNTVILAPGISGLRPATDCKFVVWIVDLIVKPHLGRVTPRQISTTIEGTDGLGRSTGICAGRKTNALQITYQANRDARGKDEVELRLRSEEAKFTYALRYHVTILNPLPGKERDFLFVEK
jgi:hypothetical protein